MGKKRSSDPTVTVKDIKDITPGKPCATGQVQLHPNFVAARRKTQFKPGQSGNPGGRRQPVIRDIILQQAMTVHDRDVFRRTYLELAAYALFQEALSGSVPAVKELFDRIEGRTIPLQRDSAQADRLDEIVRAIQESPAAHDDESEIVDEE